MNETLSKLLELAESIGTASRYQFLFADEGEKPVYWAGFEYMNGSGGPEAYFVCYGPRTYLRIPYWGSWNAFIYPYGDGKVVEEGTYVEEDLISAYERLLAWDEERENPHPIQQDGPIFVCSSGHYFIWPDGRYGSGGYIRREDAECEMAKGAPPLPPETPPTPTPDRSWGRFRQHRDGYFDGW